MVARHWKWILLACAPVAVACNLLDFRWRGAGVRVVGARRHSPGGADRREHRPSRQHLGPSSGALINATFGNLAEMIIAIFAVRAGLLEVVKASLTGSILGNLLFVGGLSMLVGGWKRDSQKFNRLSVEASAGQMVVAVAALLLPALFFYRGGGEEPSRADARGVGRHGRHAADHLRVRLVVHVPHAPASASRRGTAADTAAKSAWPIRRAV